MYLDLREWMGGGRRKNCTKTKKSPPLPEEPALDRSIFGQAVRSSRQKPVLEQPSMLFVSLFSFSLPFRKVLVGRGTHTAKCL